MYRIDTEKLSAFKEAILSLRQQIEETKKVCTIQTDSITEAWEGEAAETAMQAGQELTTLLSGEVETLCGLESVFEDALEKSHMLLNQSRSFASILENGEESRLVYSGYREINVASGCEGVIMLEESTVADVVSGCDRTAEYAREIEAITYEIDSIINSLEYAHIDISTQTARIRKDCKKVERIEEYGRSYGRYAEEFMELDRKLSKALTKYTETNASEEMTIGGVYKEHSVSDWTVAEMSGRTKSMYIPFVLGGVDEILHGDDLHVEENGQEEVIHETEVNAEGITIVVTLEQLEEFGWQDYDGDKEQYIIKFNQVLQEYNITDPASIIMFMATMGHESTRGLNTIEGMIDGVETLTPENWEKYKAEVGAKSGMDYEDRGAGYIQLSHYEEQVDFLKYIGVEEDWKSSGMDTVHYIAEYYSLEAAAYFWATTNVKETGVGSLNDYAATYGNTEGVFLVTQYFVNGYNASDEDLRDIRQGREYTIENGILMVNGNTYVAPKNWDDRKVNYYDACEIFE